ncbi:MAG TPA: UDP binding domain-containing protein, partial [Candidatus Paceibacterota bacterium]|nr:UDP binding domain-containing protein [Candidatus Paceibacterota bacterium]
IRYGRDNGFEHKFLATAREINNQMPRYTVDMLERVHGSLRGAVVALLGLAYKRDVPDLRESPALVIREELEKRGAVVRVFDPLVPGESTSTSTNDALLGADAAIIATDHSVFRSLSPEEFLSRGVSLVIDGRNCLSKENFLAAGVEYHGIGR